LPAKAPFLPYDQLRSAAEIFLARHHPTRTLPVPIEEIIEFDFKIDIIPMPGMMTSYDVDSFISSDMSEIRVDEFVYESRRKRYRFSLAHELSHRILHFDIFKDCAFTTVQQWKQVKQAVPAKDYGLLEWQANSLAGLMLVPEAELMLRFKEVSAIVEGVGFKADDAAAIEAMEGGLSSVFEVSSFVIHKRLEFDGIIKPPPSGHPS
jgi:hypothetical protein